LNPKFNTTSRDINQVRGGIKMKKIMTLLVIVGVTSIGANAVSSEKNAASNLPEEKTLEEQVKELTEMVSDLKEQIKDLEKELDKIKSIPYYGIIDPSRFPKMKKIPKNWRKREFNGMTFYLIPLDDTKKH
jgi:hypothetical protein